MPRRLGPEQFRQIGYVSENQQLPRMDERPGLLDYLRPMYRGRWDRDFEKRLLEQFELPLGTPLKSLSRGQRMKAALLSSLAYRPKLVVLDEPFSGLDPLVRDEFLHRPARTDREGGLDGLDLLARHRGGRALRGPGGDPRQGPHRARRVRRVTPAALPLGRGGDSRHETAPRPQDSRPTGSTSSSRRPLHALRRHFQLRGTSSSN